jgi:hypothetical protein
VNNKLQSGTHHVRPWYLTAREATNKQTLTTQVRSRLSNLSYIFFCGAVHEKKAKLNSWKPKQRIKQLT